MTQMPKMVLYVIDSVPALSTENDSELKFSVMSGTFEKNRWHVFHSSSHRGSLQHNAMCYTAASPVQIVCGNMPIVVRHRIAVMHWELTAWKLCGGFLSCNHS